MVQELQTEENKILIALVFGIILLFLVSIGIIIFFILSRKKIIDKEREKTELQIEHQEKILQTSIAIQETERKRIAQDLHDDISSKLNVVSLTTNMLLADNDTSKKQKETLSQILEITSKTLESSRKIAHDLLPPILDKFGLKSALEELFDEFSKNTKIDIEYNVEELLLSQTNQLHVFRILQELINNSIRHGKANELSVYMEQDSKGFIIRYQDNGVGFKISDVNKKPGIGIQNIKSRVKILNGNLTIDSAPNKGSSFFIKLIMSRKIRIAIVDDELLFRQGLKAILQAEPNFNILFDAKNGVELLDKLNNAKTKPHILVSDLKMPELNGVELAKVITKQFPEIKIIALTSYFSKPFILNMISIGAVGYLAKNSTPKLMIKTINEVYDKGFFYDEKVLNFIEEDKDKKPTKSAFDTTYFTKRELDVLNLLCRQFNSKDVAKNLGISSRTVDVHRNNLLLKTESKNIAGLVVYALKNKLVDLDQNLTL